MVNGVNGSMSAEGSKSAHVIVFGNEKGGTGKSTTCMHVLVSLLKSGQKVASIDLDSRQGTLTNYIENRERWSERTNLGLELPRHFPVYRGRSETVSGREESEFASFADAIGEVEQNYDFVVIDTPASDSYLMRLAHSMADTLVTPLNDSFVDLDVLAKIDPVSHEVTGLSHYTRMVRDARRQRRLVDGGVTDWIVVRNRMSTLDSRNRHFVGEGLRALGRQLGFRISDGIAERLIFRAFFPKGLTAIDILDEATLGSEPTLSHLTARQEIRALITTLSLPVNEKAKLRREARKIWARANEKPLQLHDIFSE